MTFNELHKYIAVLSRDHTATGVINYKAALDIYKKSQQVENYISEYDAINQAVDYYTKKWQSMYQSTKDLKFLKCIAVANKVRSEEISFNEAEVLFKGKHFDNFDAMLRYVKTCQWSRHLSYSLLKSIFEMMEISYDNKNGES